MSACVRTIILAALSIALGGLSAGAETLRCQSVNGNLNCVGSNGASCQTIDGRKVCISGHGDVIQSFGNTQTKSLDDFLRDRPRMDSRQDWQSDDND